MSIKMANSCQVPASGSQLVTYVALPRRFVDAEFDFEQVKLFLRHL